MECRRKTKEQEVSDAGPPPGRQIRTVADWQRPEPKHIDEAHMWHIIIASARYNGAYEGGRWLAVVDPSYTFHTSVVFIGDVECDNFFRTGHAERIGRGDTPDAALDDLDRRWKRAKKPDDFDWDETIPIDIRDMVVR